MHLYLVSDKLDLACEEKPVPAAVVLALASV